MWVGERPCFALSERASAAGSGTLSLNTTIQSLPPGALSVGAGAKDTRRRRLPDSAARFMGPLLAGFDHSSPFVAPAAASRQGGGVRALAILAVLVAAGCGASAPRPVLAPGPGLGFPLAGASHCSRGFLPGEHHFALDIPAAPGTPVLASAPGV